MLWQQTYGGDGDDQGYSVQQTTDGGYIIAGETTSFGAKYHDAYLIKTDSDGNIEWENTYGGSEREAAYEVQQTTDGGYIVVGETNSFGAGIKVYLIRTDASGNILWEKTFVGGSSSAGYSVQQTTDGGYIVAGRTFSDGTDNENIYLIKTDSAGSVLWEKIFGETCDAHARSVRQTLKGGYIIAGISCDDVYVLETDSSGDALWSTMFGGNGMDIGRSIQPTSDGGYILTGEKRYSDAGRRGVWLIKLGISSGSTISFVSPRLSIDGAQEVEWTRTFGGGPVPEGHSIQQTTDGGYIIAGVLDSLGPSCLIKTDSIGNVTWRQTYEGIARSVRQTTDGGCVVAGSIDKYDDISGLSTIPNLFRTDSDGNMLWSKAFDKGQGMTDAVAYSVRLNPDGGYTLAGTERSIGTSHGFLIKTDSNGYQLWRSRLRIDVVASEDQSMQQTLDDGYILVGTTRPTGSRNAYLVKADSEGNEEWGITFGGSGADEGKSVQQTSDGGYIVAGWTESFGKGQADIYLIKIDSSGSVIWERTYGGQMWDGGFSVQVTTDGGYIVAGRADSFGTGISIYLMKSDSNGNMVWERTLDGWRGSSVQQTSDGGYIVLGDGEEGIYLIKIAGELHKFPGLYVGIAVASAAFILALIYLLHRRSAKSTKEKLT
jgi:hypothetical protein